MQLLAKAFIQTVQIVIKKPKWAFIFDWSATTRKYPSQNILIDLQLLAKV